MTADDGHEAVANGREYDTYGTAMCQKFVRGPCWEVGSLYGSAIEAWNGAAQKHKGDRNPPIGAPVYYSGGTYGHAVIYTGNGMVRSTDTVYSGDVGEQPIGYYETVWGKTYLGWTGDINGVDLPLTAPDDGNTTDGDDDMPEYVSVGRNGSVDLFDDWVTITWQTVNASPDGVATVGNPGIVIPGKRYVATMWAIVDAGGPGGEWQVVEKNGVVEHPPTSGSTYVSDARTGAVGNDRRLRFQITAPSGSRLDWAAMTMLYW